MSRAWLSFSPQTVLFVPDSPAQGLCLEHRLVLSQTPSLWGDVSCTLHREPSLGDLSCRCSLQGLATPDSLGESRAPWTHTTHRMSEAALAAGEVFLSQGNRTHLALCKEFQGKQTVSFVVHTQATVGMISRQEAFSQDGGVLQEASRNCPVCVRFSTSETTQRKTESC